MIRAIFFLVFSLWAFSLPAQPYEKAPAAAKKVKMITEWVRPNLKTKSLKGMVSTFDRNGHLLTYTSPKDSSIFNTRRILNRKGQILESREGQGTDLFLTRYSYQSDRTIKESSFRGKDNRLIHFYNKKGSLIESKSYSRGLELGNAYQLRERIVYQYNKRAQRIGEKIMTYDLAKKNVFNTRKKIYHYDSRYGYLIKTVEYDYDGSPSVVNDYAYYPDKKVKSVITNYLKDQTIGTIEYLYKAGKLWQKISTDRGFRNVEIFTDGRLIRLRSYNNDRIYRVVDYEYAYY